MNTLPNPLHGDWMDSTAEWAVTNQPISEAELDRFIAEMHPPLPAHVIDRLPEDYDKPEPVTGREATFVWAWMLTPGTVAIGVAAAYFLARHGYL